MSWSRKGKKRAFGAFLTDFFGFHAIFRMQASGGYVNYYVLNRVFDPEDYVLQCLLLLCDLDAVGFDPEAASSDWVRYDLRAPEQSLSPQPSQGADFDSGGAEEKHLQDVSFLNRLIAKLNGWTGYICEEELRRVGKVLGDRASLCRNARLH